MEILTGNYMSMTELLNAYLEGTSVEISGVYGIEAFEESVIVLRLTNNVKKGASVLELYRKVIENLSKKDTISLLEEIFKTNNIYGYKLGYVEIIELMKENADLDVVVFYLKRGDSQNKKNNLKKLNYVLFN